MPLTPLELDRQRHRQLYDERSTWVEHWRDIAYNLVPRRFRYLQTDRNKGWKKNQFIINNTGPRALRTMAAGMMSGITSPSSQWLELTLADKDMARFGRVAQWLEDVTRILLDEFARSNVYNVLHSTYEYMGAFGTACQLLEEGKKGGIRAYAFPVGQYMLANSFEMSVDTMHREFSLTAGQMVDKFGLKACSTRVQRAYEEGQLDTWIEVIHAVSPNTGRIPGKLGQKNFPWRSCWFEKAAGYEDDAKGYLRESGFLECPFQAPRWKTTGEDVYGEGPGMDALGDVRALQTLERRKAQAIDKIVNPPMRAPSALMNQRVSTLPGDTIYVDANASGQTVEPAITMPPNAVEVAEQSIREHERRIEAVFFADLWLAITQSDDTQKTAREIAERHEEKMLQLGPVMESIEKELLEPMVERGLGILIRQKKLPPPPPELRGQDVKPQFISIVAQARKLLKTGGIEKLMSMVGGMVGVKPEVLDKVNTDKALEVYADALGVDPEIINDQDAVDAIRAQRAQEQQQQAQLAKIQAMAQGAATLSKADMSGDNALTRVANSLPGAAVPSSVGVN